MGHGPSRELDVAPKSKRTLAEELHDKLTSAVSRLDEYNDRFAQSRADELLSQVSKAWSAKAVEIEGYFRELTRVLIQSHQLSLDTGVDGSGIGARAFMEETGSAFERLYIRLDEDEVLASFDGKTLGRTTLEGVTYEWCEEMVVKWVITAAEEFS